MIFYGDSIVESWRGTELGVAVDRAKGIPDMWGRHFGEPYNAKACGIASAQILSTQKVDVCAGCVTNKLPTSRSALRDVDCRWRRDLHWQLLVRLVPIPLKTWQACCNKRGCGAQRGHVVVAGSERVVCQLQMTRRGTCCGG